MESAANEILPKVSDMSDGIARARRAAVQPERSRIDRVTELVGESLREVGVLIAVFEPLDRLVQGQALTVRSLGAIIAIAGPIFAIGVFLETKKSWTQ